MKISKQARREAKQLFRSCLVDGLLEENWARQAVDQLLALRPRGYVAILTHFQRMLKLDAERRLARVERAFGFRLFEAVDGVRRPTRQCEVVLDHIQAMSRHAAAIDKVGADVPGPVGRFRIAATGAMADQILSPRAGEFLARHPGLALQFLIANENVNFSRWEADLAIRLRKPEKGDFAISK